MCIYTPIVRNLALDYPKSPLKTGPLLIYLTARSPDRGAAAVKELSEDQKLKQAKVQALLHGTEEEKRKENGAAKVIVVSKAGHHLYLDNPNEFNDYIREELEETRQQTLRPIN